MVPVPLLHIALQLVSIWAYIILCYSNGTDVSNVMTRRCCNQCYIQVYSCVWISQFSPWHWERKNVIFRGWIEITFNNKTVCTHLSGKPGSASCALDSQSPVIFILSILTGQAETHCIHGVLRAVPCPVTLISIPRGFKAEVFTHRIPFLSPNQQCHSTEGWNNKTVHKEHISP